jgi:ABC-2 type transport system permease protein
MTLSLRRIARLSRWNVVLLSRNRLTLFYAAVLPLLPLALLLSGERGSETGGANAIGTVFLATVLFPVYYNVLSQFVNRRDELVLKRMRTGETRDGELVASIALPASSSRSSSGRSRSRSLRRSGSAAGQPGALRGALVVAAGHVHRAGLLDRGVDAQRRVRPADQPADHPARRGGPLTASIPDMSDGLRSILERTPGAAMAELVRSGGSGSTDRRRRDDAVVRESWSQAGRPLLVIAGWTALAVVAREALDAVGAARLARWASAWSSRRDPSSTVHRRGPGDHVRRRAVAGEPAVHGGREPRPNAQVGQTSWTAHTAPVRVRRASTTTTRKETSMGLVRVGKENPTSIDLHYEDRGTGQAA